MPFFDHHMMKACPMSGIILADEFALLAGAGVDLLGFHAKCNQGFCYFDTQIGNRHPSIPPGRDLFGEIVTACNRAASLSLPT